ncbi:M23 family metallopeptidase [Streptomyces sp. NPDC059166]|uniref:M23 family metallopeptidase n=1 Tax=Streptomyces sp. NPDC059166 TaxID=3346752 RepID=UPI0036C9C463
MNDQHPHAGYAGYDSPSTGSFDTDPLFGSLPGQYDGSHETTYGGGYAPAYEAGYGDGYDTGQWDTGAHRQASYDAYGAQAHPQMSQTYDTTGTWMPGPAATADGAAGEWDVAGRHSGTDGEWAAGDTGAFPTTTFDTTAYATGSYAAPAFGTSEHENYAPDTGTFDATAWNTGAAPESAAYPPEQTSYPLHDQDTASYQAYGAADFAPPGDTGAHGLLDPSDVGPYEHTDAYDHGSPFDHAGPIGTSAADATDGPDGPGLEPDGYAETRSEAGEDDGTAPLPDALDTTHDAAHPSVSARTAGRPVGPRGGGRGRRRTPAKRSALLTVAVPSACVMSVAGIAAASVGGVGDAEETKDETTSMAAADVVKPAVANNKLDAQLANLSADAENFADRASRTQERIDLKERQAAEKKKREEEAARREALRPKFVLPVKQHGLSAMYGQAGVNWMSVHTGIDFPVSYGTPVMAATDGTVRTQWNSAYGNMAIVTSPDGTETWYCHLSSTRIRSGSVKAGDVIAYSGSSGNSTGPHLHFEVRPGGGSAIDPMPWLRSHGLNPN